jgi:hypothetical protein
MAQRAGVLFARVLRRVISGVMPQRRNSARCFVVAVAAVGDERRGIADGVGHVDSESQTRDQSNWRGRVDVRAAAGYGDCLCLPRHAWSNTPAYCQSRGN